MIPHDPSIYEGLEALALSDDLRGWHSSHLIFRQLVAETRPRTIVEVGSWKGASAINMARLSAGLDPAPRILCCDTWLGSPEIWEKPELAAGLCRKHGYPQVYFQFLHNVKTAGFADRITPLPMTSTAAAAHLRHAGVSAELVYIDGSHDFEDVLADLRGFWPIVAPGGIMFGDDLPFPGVMGAAVGFASIAPGVERFEVVADNFWVLRKKA